MEQTAQPAADVIGASIYRFSADERTLESGAWRAASYARNSVEALVTPIDVGIRDYSFAFPFDFLFEGIFMGCVNRFFP